MHIGPLTRQNAWLFLYCCVVWKEEYPQGSGNFYLHINDRLKTAGGKAQARRAEQLLRGHMSTGGDLEKYIDQVGRRYANERARQGGSNWQRNNITGNSLEAVLQVLIHRLAGVLPSRTPDLHTLQGFELAREGYHSRPDLALFSARDFRLLVSTKWTLRKERIGTYLHEAYFYKRRRPDLQIAFVVADFNSNILRWLVNDDLVDRVYHVGLPILLDLLNPWQTMPPSVSALVSGLSDRNSPQSRAYTQYSEIRSKLFPLEQLFSDVETLRGSAGDSPDPDEETVVDDED